MAERFTPKMYIEWYARKEGLSIEDFGVAPVVCNLVATPNSRVPGKGDRCQNT